VLFRLNVGAGVQNGVSRTSGIFLLLHAGGAGGGDQDVATASYRLGKKKEWGGDAVG